jgi:septum formation inhibitor-activating ATPase MinD
MKLVSFDVGLRNLAFCVLEGSDRHNLKILSWDLIDVMAEQNGLDKPLCNKCKKPVFSALVNTSL